MFKCFCLIFKDELEPGADEQIGPSPYLFESGKFSVVILRCLNVKKSRVKVLKEKTEFSKLLVVFIQGNHYIIVQISWSYDLLIIRKTVTILAQCKQEKFDSDLFLAFSVTWNDQWYC